MLCITGSICAAQTADFSASPTSGCAPLVVSFTDNSSGTITGYSWSFGNSTSSTLQSPSTTYSSPGSYTVTLTVTGPSGSNTKTETITVYGKPTVSFVAAGPPNGCASHIVQFNSTVTANSPGTPTYSWDFGDGYSGTGANPAHTYSTPGTYPVSLTVTNGAGCSQTFTRPSYVTAYSRPVGGFTAPVTSFCSTPAAATFTSTTVGGATPYTYSWSFGDGGTGTGSTVGHNYNIGGGFTVTMIVTDANGCTSTVTAPSYISVNNVAPTMNVADSVCVDAALIFSNSTPNAGGTTWDFDDGFTATGINASHTYASSGTYTVKMTTVIAGCTKTTTKVITVVAKPTATITMNPLIPCQAVQNVTFTASSTTAASYSWTWRRGGTATGSSVIKTYNANIEDTADLTITSTFGCSSIVVKDDIMIRNILVGITPGGLCDPISEPHAGCVPLTVNFDAAIYSSLPSPTAPCAYSLYPLPAVTWLWDFGDGSPTSTLASPTHVYTAVGDYVVTCTITTPNNCVATGSRGIHVDVPVKPNFTGTPLSVCPKDPVTLLNTSTTPLSGTTYSWYIYDSISHIDDTVISTNAAVDVIARIKWPGNYNVRLTTDHKGCVDFLTKGYYIKVNPPGAKFTSSVRCAPSKTVDFTNQSSNATSQVWDFGDGITDTAFSPSHTYAATGTYTVRLTAYNSTYNCFDDTSQIVVVFAANLLFNVSDNEVCVNDYVDFEGAFPGGAGAIEYSWIIGTYQTAFEQNSATQYRFTQRGYYDISMVTRSGNNCYDTLKKLQHIVVSRPLVGFSATPRVGCVPLPVTFTDTSTNTPGVANLIRRWTYGDGNEVFSTNSTSTHTYNAPGLYPVMLRVEDAHGCRDSLLNNNYIGVHRPNAFFTADKSTVCKGAPVQFQSQSTAQALPLAHHWDFGDNTTGTGVSPVHRYTATGLYTIVLTVTDTVGCTATYTLPYQILVDAPTAAFTMSNKVAICPPLQVSFTNNSVDGVSYSWDFGKGGSPSVVTNPITTFDSAGMYPIRLVVTNANGCTDTARDTVHVLGYDGAFSYTPVNGCTPLVVNFSTPITGIPQYKWDFGDGTIVTTTVPFATHTYLNEGPYLPILIFSDGALCTSVSFGLDTIRVDKLSPDFTWTVPCMGTAFSLTQTSTARYNIPTSWSWNFGGGDTASGPAATHTFMTGGNHPVTLTVSNNFGCVASITKDVFINFLPNIDVTDDTGVCPGDRVDLFVTGGISYTWSPAPDSLTGCPVCDMAHVHLDSPNPGDFAYYYVTGVDANGCINKDSVKVFIQLKTTSTVGPGGSICVGESFRLYAEGAQRYEWIPAATIDSPFIASPLATPERSTTYTVLAREGTCIVDSQHIHVTVHSLPLFSAGPDEVMALGSAVTLKPTQSGIARIEWRPDSTLGCQDCFRPNVSPHYTRTYYATGYNEFGCFTTDSVTVIVRCNGSLVYIPNTFTPNGDGQNDYFFPRGQGIEKMLNFRVFNRWGEVVFERNNLALNDERAGWDGSYKGQTLPPDVYVYTMQSRCESGDVIQWKGDITIMK